MSHQRSSDLFLSGICTLTEHGQRSQQSQQNIYENFKNCATRLLLLHINLSKKHPTGPISSAIAVHGSPEHLISGYICIACKRRVKRSWTLPWDDVKSFRLVWLVVVGPEHSFSHCTLKAVMSDGNGGSGGGGGVRGGGGAHDAGP